MAQPARKRSIWPRLLFILVIVVVVGFGVLFFLFEQDLAATEAAYGAQLISLCNPIPGGTADRAAYPADAETPLQAVVFVEGNRYTGTYHDGMNAAWQAATQAETDLVICIRNTDQIIERCDYGDENDTEPTAFFERVQKLQDVYVYNASTSALIAQHQLRGELPEECPDQLFADDGDTRKGQGADVTTTAFNAAVEPYLTGTFAD